MNYYLLLAIASSDMTKNQRMCVPTAREHILLYGQEIMVTKQSNVVQQGKRYVEYVSIMADGLYITLQWTYINQKYDW